MPMSSGEQTNFPCQQCFASLVCFCCSTMIVDWSSAARRARLVAELPSGGGEDVPDHGLPNATRFRPLRDNCFFEEWLTAP